VSEPVVGEFVVTDLQTGLIWKRCTEGRSGLDCAGIDTSLTWTAALSAANSSIHAGFNDWRLPNIIELQSLVETSCHSPSINTTQFPATEAQVYWSASSLVPFANADTLCVRFDDGGISATNESTSNTKARLVRGGQSLDTFASEADFTPNSFGFSVQSGVPLNSLRASGSINVSGLTTPVGIAVSGAAASAYSINGGAFASAPGSVVNGDTVVVSHTSAGANSSSVTSTLSIGAVSADFVSTTAGGSNTAPTFTPAAAIARQQGSAGGAAISVGTAADAESGPGSLGVTQIAGGTAVGVGTAGIVNSAGAISAVVAASCAATSGTLRFQASDGSLNGAGDLQVNVSANTAPVLTYAATANVDGGAGSTINPASGPSDNGLVATIVLQSQGTYAGGISVNTGSGAISLSNAAPVGVHTISIRATDNCGSTTDATVQVTVNGIAPFIQFSPAAGSTIGYDGAGTASPIIATPSGGTGAGSTATTTVGACTITGGGAAFPTTGIAQLSFVGATIAPQNIALPSCLPQPATVSAVLTCPESRGGAPATDRIWTLTCQAATVSPVAPTIAYTPTTDTTISYTSAGSAAPIVATPGGGSGSGALATTTVGACSISGSGPAFALAFPTTSTGQLSFLGPTTTAQNLLLPNCVPQSSAVNANLACPESRGSATQVIRVWTLNCPVLPTAPVPPHCACSELHPTSR